MAIPTQFNNIGATQGTLNPNGTMGTGKIQYTPPPTTLSSTTKGNIMSPSGNVPFSDTSTSPLGSSGVKLPGLINTSNPTTPKTTTPKIATQTTTPTTDPSTQYAGLMSKLGQGNYNIDANGVVTPKTTTPTSTPTTPTPNTTPNTTPTAPTTPPTTTPTTPTTSTPTLGSVVTSEADIQKDPDVISAQQKIVDLNNEYQQQLGNIQGQGGLIGEAAGRAGILQANYEANLAAAQANLNQVTTNKLQGLQQAQTGLTPVQVPYSNQYISPTSPEKGNLIGGGTTGSLEDAASLYASRVLGGKMSYSDAVSALSSYGPAGQQALTKLLGSNFNTVQSNINTAIQGQLGPAAQNAANQLQNLQTTLSSSPALETTFSPLINKFYQLFSSTTGVQAGGTQALQSALTDARAAVANALGVANNSTPSTYDAYVQTLLPDGITTSQLSNAIQQFQNQIQGKLQAFSNPGATIYSNSSQEPITGFNW